MVNLSIEELLNIKLNVLNNGLKDDGERWEVIEKFFQYYRNKGFPFYNLSDIELNKEWDKFHSYDVRRILLNDNELQQVMMGLSLCNNYHPEMWSVKCRNRLSPMEVYLDDNLFKKALYKRLKMSDSKMAIFNVRKSLKIFSGAQSVSNFRPTIAKFLYEKYCNSDSLVLDPCMGYGGRLLGSSLSVGQYVGVDPNKETVANNVRLADFIKAKNNSFKYEFYNVPFEDFEYRDGKSQIFDFAFTSPPYFNVEKYSYEETQSWVRYPEYKTWVEKFLTPLISKTYNLLKPNTFFALNVHGDEIIEDALRIAKYIGFDLPLTYKMRLSKICGRGQDKQENKFKHEPIFMFYKKS